MQLREVVRRHRPDDSWYYRYDSEGQLIEAMPSKDFYAISNFTLKGYEWRDVDTSYDSSGKVTSIRIAAGEGTGLIERNEQRFRAALKEWKDSIT